MRLLEVASTGRFDDLVVPADIQPTIRQASLLLVAATTSAPRGWSLSGSLRIWRRPSRRRGRDHVDQLTTNRAGEPEGRLAWTAQVLGVAQRLSAAAELTASDPAMSEKIRDVQLRVGLLLALIDDIRTPKAADDLVRTLGHEPDETLALWNSVGVLPPDLVGRALAVGRLDQAGYGPKEDWQRLARLAADLREEGNERAAEARDESRYGGVLISIWNALPFYEAATHLVAIASHRRKAVGESDTHDRLAAEALACDETRANAVEALTSLGRYFVSRPCHLLGGLEGLPIESALRTVLLSTRAGLPAYPRCLELEWDEAVDEIGGASGTIPNGSDWTGVSFLLEEEMERRFSGSFVDTDLARAGLLLEPELRMTRTHDLADGWATSLLTAHRGHVHEPGRPETEGRIELRPSEELLAEIMRPRVRTETRRRR